jgi:adenosine deaminase
MTSGHCETAAIFVDIARVLPKAELHVHVEGTLEPELLVRLARRNGVALRSNDPAELRAEYRFTSLQSLLDLYYRNVAVLRTDADFRELGAAYLARAARAGVRRAEIFADAQQHVSRGCRRRRCSRGCRRRWPKGRRRTGSPRT